MLKSKPKNRKFKKSEKGMAIIEAIPVLFMLVLVFNFSLGFFGAVHSGVLNSIASYNYTLETFRFKSNLMYFRPGASTTHYAKTQNRVHGTTQDGSVDTVDNRSGDGKWPATLRGITFNYKSGTPGRDLSSIQTSENERSAINDSTVNREFKINPGSDNVWSVHSKATPTEGQDAVQTTRVWIKTVYGICLNAECKAVN
ncbi:MAG: hypothetical protein A2622_06100 [Bdellovibrionales bacterium RIFCSPHIGHO2_01_FULL_40_29]|nr:MAG: hypothetical protein A2622_06100 [Bdellovibrionales bacterium RIFCSPHIGHO2_01_FULL_40_29]OFZ35021.1 MAG: hypothetical protein A3D17_06450 [Bdellovibrionales bacterium RIFCSPHIGHO2_02_FULL_40_15]